MSDLIHLRVGRLLLILYSVSTHEIEVEKTFNNSAYGVVTGGNDHLYDVIHPQHSHGTYSTPSSIVNMTHVLNLYKNCAKSVTNIVLMYGRSD